MTLKAVNCLNCLNYIGKKKNSFDHTCKAFELIPEEIWEGEIDHKKPYEGDNGIQFEKEE